ncbi:MAG: Na/Pi cotransporter family protein [Christensenellales bacterium]
MSVYNVFSLLGGLAFFLFGMQLMGESLEKRAGARLKPILEQLTSSPIKGVILGAGVTAIIQSSSATTVMIVGFVNSGIMVLKQAISVVMGANIGTTITAWILSLSGIQSSNFWVSLFKPSTFSPLLAFAGMVMLFFSKRRKDLAGIFLGFAILMFGMDTMSGAVSGLSKDQGFISLLTLFSNPVFGVAIGAIVTAIIQSSSASVGILQALANTGVITFASALPIIMGQNIGTCITAIISAIGANTNAKRVATVHLCFNLIGTLLFLPLFYLFDWIFQFSFVDQSATALGIAIAHTVFNVFTVTVLFPFIPQLEKLAIRLVKGDKRGERFEVLDDRLLATPSIAVDQCRKLAGEMAVMARDAFLDAMGLLDHFDMKKAEAIAEAESQIDLYEDKLGAYLVKVGARQLSARDSQEVSKLLHIIGDFERISDHALNLMEVADEIHAKRIQFSPAAQYEIQVMRTAVSDCLKMTVTAFNNNDLALAEQVEPLEEVVDDLRSSIKAAHIDRLKTGFCTIELGFVLSDLLTNLERVGDHCSNIAASMVEIERHGSVDAHGYKLSLTEGEAAKNFQQQFAAFSEKYKLDYPDAPAEPLPSDNPAVPK